MGKLLFLDLDGTLLDDRKEITAGNRRALTEVIEKGNGVVITTGRPLLSAMEQARRMGLDTPGCYLIAYNGAQIYDWASRKTVYSQTLELEDVYRIFDRCTEKNIHVQTYDATRVLVEPRWDDSIVRLYCSRILMEHRVIGDVRRDLREPPVKCLAIDFECPEKLGALQSWVDETMGNRVDAFFSCNEYLEIVPAGMNKGNAVRMLCRLMNVEIENAVAVGDAANDISMIRAAGVGVAMANGTEEVKAVADYITQRDNNHDAIQEVAERFF